MIIFDAHADTPTRLLDENKSLFKNDLHIDLKRLLKNECMQVFATFISPEYKNNAMERVNSVVANFLKEAEKNEFAICKTHRDIEIAKGPCGILSLETILPRTLMRPSRSMAAQWMSSVALSWTA